MLLQLEVGRTGSAGASVIGPAVLARTWVQSSSVNSALCEAVRRIAHRRLEFTHSTQRAVGKAPAQHAGQLAVCPATPLISNGFCRLDLCEVDSQHKYPILIDR